MDGDHQHSRAAIGRLPDFMIVGATRSGTTSLHHYLGSHPDIFLPAEKELNFFSRGSQHLQRLPEYRHAFRAARKETVIGEASPMYWVRGMSRDHSGDYQFNLGDDPGSRLAAVLPGVKTIISLRDPVRRAYSQYWRNHCRGQDTAASFLDSLQEEREGRRTPQQTRMCWIYHNSYTVHLRRWFELFPRDQIKVLIFEEWTQRPQQTLRDLLEFLEVDPDWAPEDFSRRNAGWEPRSQWWADWVSPWLSQTPGLRRLERWNRRAGYSDLSGDTYLRAQDIFADEISELERLLGRDLAPWQLTEKAASA